MNRRGFFKALAAIAAAPVAWKLGREQAKEDRITGQTSFANIGTWWIYISDNGKTSFVNTEPAFLLNVPANAQISPGRLRSTT